jgi:SPP1 gp7 family putative phage head morphogenesis protein
VDDAGRPPRTRRAPRRGAGRELEEETNLTTPALELVESFTNPGGTEVWLYRCQVRGKPTGYYDPDQECSEWRFFDVTNGLPPEVAAMVAGPVDPEHNVLLRLFGPRGGEHADAAPRGRGAAIGAGRAAQLGAARAKAEEAEWRAKAAIAGAELRRASEQGKRAAAAIDRAARAFTEEFHPRALHAVVRQFGQQTDEHGRRQLDQQLRSAIGVPLSAVDRPHRDKLDEWAAVNVDLIKTVPERYFDRIRLDVLDAFEGGTHPSTLAEELAERHDMSERDAERIARDQVLSLSADLNQQRMTDLGVERYYWRDAGDGRVRENHEELAARSDAGETFSFDDPPLGGGTDEGEEGNPGDGILCRCYPDPVLDDLING